MLILLQQTMAGPSVSTSSPESIGVWKTLTPTKIVPSGNASQQW